MLFREFLSFLHLSQCLEVADVSQDVDDNLCFFGLSCDTPSFLLSYNVLQFSSFVDVDNCSVIRVLVLPS